MLEQAEMTEISTIYPQKAARLNDGRTKNNQLIITGKDYKILKKI